MNRTFKLMLDEFGTEEVIARIMEQLNILATCNDQEAKKAAISLVKDCGCDTEYIYTLCTFTNLVAYVSEFPIVSDGPWIDAPSRPEVPGFSKEFSDCE